MNTAYLKKAWCDNWHMVIAVVICLGAGTYAMATAKDTAEVESLVRAPTYPVSDRVPGAPVLDAAQRRAEVQQAKARAIIRAHQQRIDEHPDSEESPALLAAMGNLYTQKLGDYQQAAQCYNVLLQDYPDWPGRRTAYVQLATCYERLGDLASADRVYRRMAKVVPQESQEYQYARAKLAGEIPALP